MSSEVVWQPRALRGLATAWLRSFDRNAVTAAANRIESILSRDPFEGESRDRGQRVFFAHPLLVEFLYVADDDRVLITQVTLLREK